MGVVFLNCPGVLCYAGEGFAGWRIGWLFASDKRQQNHYGNKWPYPDTLTKLAEALGVEVHSLFIIDRSPKEEMEQLKKEIVFEIKETVSKVVMQSFAEESKKQKKKVNRLLPFHFSFLFR